MPPENPPKQNHKAEVKYTPPIGNSAMEYVTQANQELLSPIDTWRKDEEQRINTWRENQEDKIKSTSNKRLGKLDNTFRLGLLQRLFVHINAFLYGKNTTDSIEIKNESDIEKIKDTFRGIINFEDSNIDLQIGKTVKYDMDRGILEIISGKGENQVTESSFRIDPGDPNRKPIPSHSNTEETSPLREGQEKEYALARELGQFVKENGPYTAGGKNSCGEAVGQLLTSELDKRTGKRTGFGIKGLPSSGRNGNAYTKILEDRPYQFRREKVFDFRSIKPGGIIVYTGKGTKYGKENGSSANQQYGHVEIKNSDGNYTSFYTSRNPGGSARFDPRAPESFQEQTGWTGYVYYPISKEIPQAFKGAEKRDTKKK